MRTIVYVDGFNIYYAIRRTNYRWLNHFALAQTMLPNDHIVEVKYFTAPVKAQPDDPGAPNRQQLYLRALRTLGPTLTIHHGSFLRNKNRMPLTWRPTNRWQRWLLSRGVKDPKLGKKAIGLTPTIKVWRTEEKGSDVNLASHLLIDGFNGAYELAVVISNDGDLEFPIRYVRDELKLPVGVMDARDHRNRRLSPDPPASGSFYKKIRNGPLSAAQFPTTMTDGKGQFHMPPEWAGPKKR